MIFRSDNPKHYVKGFPWHPIEARNDTYILRGEVEHRDSMGNSGVIHSGDVQMDDSRERDHPSGDAEGDKKKVMLGFQLGRIFPLRTRRWTLAPGCEEQPNLRSLPQGWVKVKILCGW